MSGVTYSALIELPGGRMVAVGEWPHPSGASAWALSLVTAGLDARVAAIVPHVPATTEGVAALAEECGQ